MAEAKKSKTLKELWEEAAKKGWLGQKQKNRMPKRKDYKPGYKTGKK